MNVLIVSATRLEIASSLQYFKKMNAEILFTGVGIAATAYTVTKAVLSRKPCCIIQAGIAGCFDKRTPLGSVFAVSQDSFGDLGVTEHKQWKSLFDLGLVNANGKPFKNSWLKNPHKMILKNCGLEVVPAVTVNEISTNKTKINLLRSNGAVVESMEGAALHYVALMERIPFLQIRAVSNYVGERDKSRWDFKAALGNLNRELVRLATDMTCV